MSKDTLQGIIQEFNLGVDSHVSITLWCKLCCWWIWGGGGGGAVRPCCKPLFCYISLLHSLIQNTFFVDNYSNFSVFNFKLEVQTNYPLAWMFFFCTLATAFPTSYRMKTCSCWVWKLSYDACPLSLVTNASFLTQSDW